MLIRKELAALGVQLDEEPNDRRLTVVSQQWATMCALLCFVGMQATCFVGMCIQACIILNDEYCFADADEQ